MTFSSGAKVKDIAPRREKTLVDSYIAAAVLVALTPLVYGLGYVFRPDTVTSDRSGYWIALEASSCESIADCFAAGFPSGLFGLLRLILPLPLNDYQQWDMLLGALGLLIMLALSIWLSRNPSLSIVHTMFFLAATALSSMYIFILSKDVIQALYFLILFAAALFIRKRLMAVAILTVLFVLEGVLWRSYFLIIACFFGPLYYLLSKREDRPYSPKEIAGVVLLFVLAVLVFAFVLRTVSPSNYAEIVDQHGVDREEYTAVVAASGIKSLIPVNASSPVPLFVLNWLINTLRLLFPVELFAKGPYYWVFAAYQLLISVSLLVVLRHHSLGSRQLLCIAVFLAFVLASGAFEPDFGSWVRHETACLPFLIVAVTGYIGVRSDASPRLDSQAA